jgi:hypothetical protein
MWLLAGTRIMKRLKHWLPARQAGILSGDPGAPNVGATKGA